MILALTCLEINDYEGVGGGIFGRFSNVNNFRPKVASDVLSSMVVEPTGTKAPVKLGDSRSNRSRDIRLPHFVTNDHDNDDVGVHRSSHQGKMPNSASDVSRNLIGTML